MRSSQLFKQLAGLVISNDAQSSTESNSLIQFNSSDLLKRYKQCKCPKYKSHQVIRNSISFARERANEKMSAKQAEQRKCGSKGCERMKIHEQPFAKCVDFAPFRPTVEISRRRCSDQGDESRINLHYFPPFLLFSSFFFFFSFFLLLRCLSEAFIPRILH